MPYTPTVVAPIYKSIIRHVNDLIEEINALDLVEDEVQYHNWEERSNEGNLPSTTLLGTDGFSFDENDGRWIVRYALALSSYEDSNLLREIDVLDYLHQRLKKNSKVPLREMNLGEEVNELIVADFQIMPMGQSELRNYRTIGIQLNRTGA